MWEVAGSILVGIGKSMLIISFVITVVGIISLVYVYVIKDILDYRKARKEIFEFVKSYKKRCTKNNRFVVEVPELQNIFKEYDTIIINRIWLELVHERVIEQDPKDNAWCIR